MSAYPPREEEPAQAGAPSPFRVESSGRYRSRRTRRPGEVNLKSSGLLDARAADLHRRTLAGLDPLEVLTYPVLRDVYAEIADHLDADPDGLVLTAGSDPGLGLLVRAFPRARRIVLHHPNYEGWQKFARIAGCRLDQVPPDPGTGRFSLADLAARLRGGPPAFVVVTQPHSFTGQVHARAELESLARAVADHGSLLVLDTAYLAFTEGGEKEIGTLTGRPHPPHVVRVNTFSKCFGLSGARIAVLSSHPDTVRPLLDLDPEGPVSGTAVALLRACLREQPLFEEIWAGVREVREHFARGVEEALPGWRALPGGGNFATWQVASPREAADAAAHLHAHGYVVRAVPSTPDSPAAVRIGVTDRSTADRVTDLLLRREQAVAR
ncbi:aminotransferase class I/II-fold pyridoxal phosphate-dependent enzyme [Streptomyces sp. MBT49]|uniref:aminotransferase class I/II-fold pyridoxal phosphate-dependent enzyme n=1 Tax=Streptomyces sp. MBT49 TaxID=1488380 RepID=UPI00190DC429|nr:aminotransferase class I/II-fold pyridoxal phosphate-dependent enzyme [Streptomyces sp. MBT49]MBK3626061.1 aminotransferase class I/II-fold pyridoxal phosphate-dependent enzyme [Streptomyces sp. MBT49]